jgi:hypothetical protein
MMPRLDVLKFASASAATFFLATLAAPAPALDCEAVGLRSTPGPTGYAQRDEDRRCEGFF